MVINMMFKKLLLILLLLLQIGSVTSCNGSNEKIQYITFKDDLNRTVTLNSKPKRVVTLLGSFYDVWICSGGTAIATASDTWDEYEYDLSEVSNIGGVHSPNLELILKSNPDFIIASASTSKHILLKNTFEQIGIPIAYFEVNHFNDYLNMLKICTSITDRPDLYEINGTKIKDNIDEIINNYQKFEYSKETKKVLLLRASSTSVKCKGSSGTILGEMLSEFECLNIADGNIKVLENLSVEEISKEDPYYIFIVTMGSNEDFAIKKVNDLLNSNVVWKNLNAVKNNRVYIMDKELFNTKPNARWEEAYLELYEILTK